MFNSTTFRTENHDLLIASKKCYQDQINLLNSDLRKACTPDQLEKAESIVDKFRESLVFKYISAENSLVNAVVWKTHSMSHSLSISFLLNKKEITVKLPDIEVIARAGLVTRSAIEDIKLAISQAIAREISQLVYVEVIQNALPKEK